MNNPHLARRLSDMASMERDATRAYTQAMGRVGDEAVRRCFTFIRDQHERQFQDLRDAAHKLGGQGRAEEPSEGSGPSGVLGDTTDTESILRVLSDNEGRSMEMYRQASQELQDLPMDMRAMLFNNFKLEQIHYDLIDRVLLGRSIWKQESH